MSLLRRLIPLIALSLVASAKADTFVADQNCPLYQSKNKLTNPGEVMTVPGQRYSVLEVLGNPNRPDWVRLETAALTSSARWVNGRCGKIEQQGASADSGRCDLAGEQDSHILALSWQGAFCELYGKGKRECHALEGNPDDARWQALTLHGLWPNKASCGTDYGFCGSVHQKARGFCNYPAIALNKEAETALAGVMPSAEFSTCLDRHQWWKHGSCQTMDASDYFIEAARLTRLVNESRMAKALAQSSGKMQTTANLRKLFTEEFGKHSGKRVSFHCSRGLLTEVRLSLPDRLDSSIEIKHLMARSGPDLRDSCPASFLVDKPG
ncbi:ribonuclease T [Shewanella khirikhana]|uniref:ribonuclease T2 family protein n=1 Tax=Shewanella khirikhana TaxID=1965282 RepID=UPI0030CF5B58